MGLGHFYFVVIGEGQKISDESRRGGSENFFDGSWGGGGNILDHQYFQNPWE